MKTFGKIAAWVFGMFILAGWTGLALAAALPEPLAQRVLAACQRAHQAGIMDKVAGLDQEVLLALAEAPCPEVRAVSIYALGETRDGRAVPALIGRLGDGDKAVRRISARALGKIGDPAAAEPLIATMEDQKESMAVRCVAARALGMLSDIRAAHALMRATKADHGALQASAVNALHNMNGFLELRDQMVQFR